MTSTPSSASLVHDANARTLALGRETLDIEAQAVHQLVNRVGPAFVTAVQAMVRLMDHSRSFEQQIKIIKESRQIDESGATMLRPTS